MTLFYLTILYFILSYTLLIISRGLILTALKSMYTLGHGPRICANALKFSYGMFEQQNGMGKGFLVLACS